MKKLLAHFLIGVLTCSIVSGQSYVTPESIDAMPQGILYFRLMKYPDVEFYAICRSTKKELMRCRLNKKHSFGRILPSILGPFMSFDPQFPMTTFELIGTSPNGDRYDVTLDPDAFPSAPKQQILFSGIDQEVWTNDEFIVGMRPAKKAE